ncbi:MAG: TraR/DksA family transcriptional regulator [Verrucomicrobiota bacterium]
MAAKKNTPKKAAPKGKAKPAAKPVKKAVSKKAVAAPKKALPAKKAAPVAKKAVKKAAVAKKPAPAKKPVSAKKPAVVKKATPAKAAKPVVKPVAKKVVEKEAAAPKAKVEIKKPVSVKTPEKKPIAPIKEAKKPEVVEVAVVPAAPHSDAFIQKQRQRLLDLRDELVDSMSGMTRDTIRNAPEGSEASGSGQHQGDAGSDAYDRDFALSVLAKEQDALYEIEEALVRIRKGFYGICELSNRKIPQARLEAIPFARLTVECQAQWEKEYGKRRFRPSNEVGFSGGKYADDEDSESVSLDEEED